MNTYLRSALSAVAITGVITALASGAVGVVHADPVVDPSSSPTSSASASASSSSASPAPTASPTATAAPTYAPGMAPNEHAGWAVIDPVTGQQTGGVMVCTPEVCGSGWFAGMRVALQTLQDPVEAARAANGVGNVAGYQGGTYDFATGRWTYPGQSGSTWHIPLAYPGADQGGTVNVPVCIANCPTPEPTGSPSSDPSGSPSGSPSASPTGTASPEPSATSDPSGVVAVAARARGFAVTLAPLRRATGVTTVVARKNGKVIMTWTLQPGSKKISFILPSSYKGVTLTVTRKGTRNMQLILV